MGHIRISVLPKTQIWQNIVQQIAGMHVSETEVSDIAQQTIQNVRSQFRHITQDNGVLAAFQFLVNLAVASREENPQVWLLNLGIELPDNPTPLAFAKAVSAWIAPKRDSFEYSEIAQKAAGDAISKWFIVRINLEWEAFLNRWKIRLKPGVKQGMVEVSVSYRVCFSQNSHNGI